jgi:hypothetical protein
VPASDDDDDALPAVGKVWDNSGPSLSELLKQRQPAAAAPVEHKPDPAPVASECNVESVDLNQLPEVWQRMLDLLAARRAWLHSAMKTGRLASIEDDAAVLRFDKNHATFVKMLSNKKDLLRDIFTQAAGKPLGVRFEVDESASSNGHDETGNGNGNGATAVMAPPAPATRVEPARAPARPVQREVQPPPPPPAPAVNLI